MTMILGKCGLRGGGMCLIGLIVFAAMSATAPGQGLLDRLEKRLRDARPATPAATDAATATTYWGFTAQTDRDRGGAVVESVDEAGPAAAAGLAVADRIVAIETVPIANRAALEQLLNQAAIGQATRVMVDRAGSPLELALVPTAAVPPPPAPALPRRLGLGVKVSRVTDEARQRYGLTVREGAVITSVTPESPAAQGGVVEGMVVVAADGQRVGQPDDLIALVKRMPAGATLTLTCYEGERLVQLEVSLPAEEPPVGGEPAAAELPPPDAPEPSLQFGGGAGVDRPVLRQLERTLDGLRRAPAAGAAEDVARLRQQVAALEQQMEQLRQRLAALEAEVTRLRDK